MPFVITVGFATEHDRSDFVERAIPKLRGHQADPQAFQEEGNPLHSVGIAVTSSSAARDLCHQIVAFLAHSKSTRVDVAWSGAGGEEQSGQINSGSAGDAETLAIRVGAAAKSHLDAEKHQA